MLTHLQFDMYESALRMFDEHYVTNDMFLTLATMATQGRASSLQTTWVNTLQQQGALYTDPLSMLVASYTNLNSITLDVSALTNSLLIQNSIFPLLLAPEMSSVQPGDSTWYVPLLPLLAEKVTILDIKDDLSLANLSSYPRISLMSFSVRHLKNLKKLSVPFEIVARWPDVMQTEFADRMDASEFIPPSVSELNLYMELNNTWRDSSFPLGFFTWLRRLLQESKSFASLKVVRLLFASIASNDSTTQVLLDFLDDCEGKSNVVLETHYQLCYRGSCYLAVEDHRGPIYHLKEWGPELEEMRKNKLEESSQTETLDNEFDLYPLI
jgi:hypothetical protein